MASSSSPLVTLFVHSPSTRVAAERRLPLTSSLAALQAGPRGLEGITGLAPSQQRLQLWSTNTAAGTADARLIWDSAASETLDVESITLASIGARDGMGLKVMDKSGRGGAAAEEAGEEEEELDAAQRYEMTDEEYRSRSDTVLAFKQRNKLGRFAPEAQAEAAAAASPPSTSTAALPPVGSRCEIQDASPPFRRGTVRYVGPVAFPSTSNSNSAPPTASSQPWIGIELDEPSGKHDGVVGDKRYFTCAQRCGAFVRPERVRWGTEEEYPVRDLLDEEEEDGEEDEM